MENNSIVAHSLGSAAPDALSFVTRDSARPGRVRSLSAVRQKFASHKNTDYTHDLRAFLNVERSHSRAPVPLANAWHDLCSTTSATGNESVMTIVRQDGSVEFRFFRPEARDVRVAGDFNGWSGESLVMKPVGNGWWTARAALGSGEFRFRYVADGRWFTDYASNGVEFAKLGLNSLLIVPKQEGVIQMGNDERGDLNTRRESRPSSERDNAKSAVM